MAACCSPVPLTFMWYQGALGSLLSGGVVALNWFMSSMPTAGQAQGLSHKARVQGHPSSALLA